MTTRRCSRDILWISDRKWWARKTTRLSSTSTGLPAHSYRIIRLPCRWRSEPQFSQSTLNRRNLRQSCTRMLIPLDWPTRTRIWTKACNRATPRPTFWAGLCALLTCPDNRASYSIKVWFITNWLGHPLPCTTANPLCKTKLQSRKRLSSPITRKSNNSSLVSAKSWTKALRTWPNRAQIRSCHNTRK